MTTTAERPGVGMNAAEWAGVISAFGAVAVGLWKGVPAVIAAVGRAIRDRDKEIQKVKDDAAKLVEAERKAAYDRSMEDLREATDLLNTTRAELAESREAEQDCKVTLARLEAHVAHVENQLQVAKIPYVPFEKTGRTGSDPKVRNRPKPRGES